MGQDVTLAKYCNIVSEATNRMIANMKIMKHIGHVQFIVVFFHVSVVLVYLYLCWLRKLENAIL